MSATGRAEAYDRHTGRYGPELSAAFVCFVGIEPEMRVLDVGCGPGALTKRLAHIVGGDRVLAVDPSEAYVDACRQRVPGVAVRAALREEFRRRLAVSEGRFRLDARAWAVRGHG
jgi:cyclopropane fatty-acyl-phospholipid synthase-like methyltransferase